MSTLITVLLLGFLTLGLLPEVLGQLVLNSISPSYGSLAGGTRLSIYGSGFGDMYTDTTVVYVGSAPCHIIHHYSSSEVLTCETTPALAGTYFVYVSVNGAEPVSIYGYTYADWMTPTFKVVSPRGGPPGTHVFLYGSATYKLQYTDCVESSWGETGCVGSILFGDYLCRFDPSVNDTGISFTSWYVNYRYGSGNYRIGCVLPSPDANNWQPALGTARNLNASVHFEASMRGATPRTLRYSYQYTVDSTPYHFQLHSEISSISPSIGSNAGGTTLDITGRGFPELDLDLGDTIQISAGGVPCTVLNSTYDRVFCITGVKPATLPADAVPIGGLYPGMRGVEYEFYNVSRSVGYYELWKLNRTIFLNDTNTTGSYKEVITSGWEGLDWGVSYYCSRMKAFFTAPYQGNYTFFLQTDDVGQLNATYLQPDGSEITRMLLNVTYYVPTDNWFDYWYSRAAPLHLEASQRVLLEVNHCNGPSIGHQQLGVLMPVPEPRVNSLSEYQQIAVRSVLTARSVALKFMYGAGADTAAWTITILSRNDSKFDDPALGLELVIGDSSFSRVITVPVHLPSFELTSMIRAAFANVSSVLNVSSVSPSVLTSATALSSNSTSSNSSSSVVNNSTITVLGLGSNTTFGVSKQRNSGIVTVQIGIQSDLAAALGFEVQLARIVQLPSGSVFSASACAIATTPSSNSSNPPSSNTTATPDITKGVVVVLAPTQPVSAVEPSGFFELSSSGSSLTTDLPYTANETTIASAVRNQTGQWATSVTVSTRREGTYLARVWNITFDVYYLNSVPALYAAATTSMPAGAVMMVETRLASPPVTGSFRVSYGSDCSSVAITIGDSSDIIVQKLAALPGFKAPLSVEVTGGPSYGYNYLITFDPVGNPGDQPPLRIADISALGGIAPDVKVITLRNGTTDAFYGPIPAEFLNVAVAQPGALDVKVNRVSTACADTTGICGFQFSDAATPTITGASSSTLTFDGVSSLPLTITGTKFDEGKGVEVRIGGVLCEVLSFTATEVSVTVPDTAPAGIRPINLTVLGLGRAAGSVNVTLKTVFITGSVPAPIIVNATGLSVLTFKGKGFDYVDCSNNRFFIGSTECGVVACNATSLMVVYPAAAAAAVTAASVTVKVYDHGTQIDTDTPSSPTVAVSLTAPAISALTRSTAGVVRVTLDNASPADVTTAYLVPYITDFLNYTALSAAYKARIACTALAPAADGGSAVTCNATAPNGRYHALLTLSSGLRLLSSTTVVTDLFITSVTPRLGSIGGGTTLTITGGGFTPDLMENAVFVTVPVSSTFLNGIVECMVASVTETQLTCETLPHLAADADVDDPMAKKVMPIATDSAPISVVICEPMYNTTILRGYCWALDATPRSRCAAADESLCSFGYSTSLTPVITGVSPARGAANAELSATMTVSGWGLAEISVVQFLQDGQVKAEGGNVVAGSGGVSCTLPDLPAGVYTLLLKKGNGEMSVDPEHRGVFTYAPVIKGVSGNVGSLAGGLPLSLVVGGSGLTLPKVVNGSIDVAAAAEVNAVSINGLPCPILSMDSRWQVTCAAPAINGYVFAEYWNLPSGTWSMPDLLTWVDPVATRLEKGLNLNWQSSSPIPSVVNLDYFAARFTFYYQIAETENVTFYISSDDDARLYVDDILLGSRFSRLNVVLTPGIHKILITYAEYAGAASIKLYVALTPDGGSLGDFSVLEWQKVTPVVPGTALPIDLTVNGVAADVTCPGSSVTLQLPYQTELPYEPPSVVLPDGACAYAYSCYRTPTLSVVKPVGALSGVLPPPFVSGSNQMTVFGTFLTDPARDAAIQINVTVANRTCTDVAVSPYQYVVNSTVVNTANQTVNVSTTYNTTRVTCLAPALPVGTWPVNILVSGIGLARPTASATTDLPVVTYAVRINSTLSPPLAAGPAGTTSCRFSLFGGGTLNVTGYGFVKGAVDPSTNRIIDVSLNRSMAAMFEASNLCTSGSVGSITCMAASASRLTIAPLASADFTATFRLSRFTVPNPGAYAGNASVYNVVLRFRPRVFYGNTTQNDTTQATFDLNFCGGRTPLLSNVAPSTVSPNAGGSLRLSWYLSAVGSNNNTIFPTPTNTLSNASIEFQVGPTILPCASPIVNSSAITATTYTETVTCQLPSYMPAAAYTLWLCIQPFGCGQLPAYTVPLTVTGINATRGSTAGGIVVTITGNGFDKNRTLVAARFGDSNCTITSSTATTVVCVTGPLAAKPASDMTFPLSITSTVGAAEATLSGFTFTFDPALEATVNAVSPWRGSTEGGTSITISGADFQAGIATTVKIGDVPCTSVAVVSSTIITCVTGKPPKNVLRVPLPVSVFQEGRGLARSTASYQYIDLWSRNTTWGGGPLPGFEDSVVIPAGITVLLDMSPPKLYFLVLEGNLVFDDTLPYINLQAHYILVKGGNFSIGTPDTPFPGKANITMHGAPTSKDLPMYGAKALGVRTGVVTFHGKPKFPVYTKLNRTANQYDTTITVNGVVNWEIGDQIVIASSSYYVWENDEATIRGIDTATVPGCTILTLDAPLEYTHIGEIHTQEGVDTPLDMRAEVAVLTRNIVLQGDWTSAKNQYGVQVMVNTPKYLPMGIVRFDNIEITQSGQAFRLGRYSMHWHLQGDVNFQTWLRGCSIHHTYNRAITVHGTHHAIIQNVVAYNTMGHTFFLEDGIESGNLIEGNLGIYARPSDALLNTDVTPGMFWITNPNNTIRNNVAVGSHGYGFWYRMLDNPEGPSYTSTVCPKFIPLLEFSNNTAHSNMFYGLRIHPEYYPRNVPCNGFAYGSFDQVPAVFDGLVAYKNGVKGAVASQVGWVQINNVIAGDNGGGPRQHIISGKDHGASLEMSWVIDDRDRYDIDVTQMAGFFNATIYARTTTGAQGTAGAWPSSRRITGTISQSAVQGDPHHMANMAMVNLTFVDFVESKPGFSALEACGKCKNFQGGSTTITSGLKFVQSDFSKPVLSFWSWGHQGIFLDLDGSLLNADTLPEQVLPAGDAGWTFGSNATWHSAVDSELFDPAECVYVRGTVTSNNGAYCSPALTFRRIMVNKHGPESIMYKDLLVTSLATNRTSIVHFSHYNEDGYQFTTAATRDYWLQWDMPFRFDPEYYTMHKGDLLTPDHFTYYSAKYIQKKNHFKVNGYKTNATELPPPLPTTPHGAFYYNKTFEPNTWWWSNRTYNDTKFTMFTAGRNDAGLRVQAFTCPDEGCSDVPDIVIDVREGILYWSNISTWNTSAINNFRKPVEGDAVTIPQGWDLVIDESPPPLKNLTVQGILTFDRTKAVTLNLTNILVMGQGLLRVGNASAPHLAKATIYLNASRDTPDFGVDNILNLGSKFLAAINGGTIEMFGRPVNKRWTRLNARAAPGATSISLSDTDHGWAEGDTIIITATSFNVWESEIRTITAITDSGRTLELDSPLKYVHSATFRSFRSGRSVDMRAEVGLLSSNILIAAADGPSTHSYNGEMFGARVVISGNATGRFTGVAMEYCGQAGFFDRACVFFDRLAPVVVTNAANESVMVENPSMLAKSALVYGMAGNVRINGTYAGVADPVSVLENVMWESWESHGVVVASSRNRIKGNLVLGTIKDMAGKSTFDLQMPSSFWLINPNNFISDNVAAGSERYGYTYYGVPCATNYTGYFINNTAHSNLAGIWLQASEDSEQDHCTLLKNFTTYLNWDFGIISTRGIPTDIFLSDVNVLDNKHSGVTLLRKGGLTDEANIWWRGGVLVGQSSPDVCAACASLSDSGCHAKMSAQSYNQDEPFTPAMGLESAQFAIAFKEGPEPKPWDMSKGYAIIHGMFNISDVTLAGFYGNQGCGGASAGTYALANHHRAMETFWPHFFSRMTVEDVSDGAHQGMYYHTPPSPSWLGESACGDAYYNRTDGSVITLNCAGPNHIYWRDLDGSLSGTIGTVAGQFQIDSGRVYPMDQGTPLLPGPCTWSPTLMSYQCVPNSDTFLLDPTLKPNPIPKAGIWGDPQYFVLESRDKDSEDRNFGPVFFNVSGSIDLVIVQADHGCCFTYKCQKRLSTFSTYLPTGQTTYITFRGTPANVFRLWLPYADPDAELVVVINYLSSLSRRFVYMPRDVLPDKFGRLVPESKPPTIGDGTGHGAYYWDQFNQLFYVKLTGGKQLEVRTENAVYVTQKFALTVNDFYDIQTIFLNNLAYAMNITLDRLFIAKIVSGSTVATLSIAPEAKDLEELTIVEGRDANDPVPAAPPAEPPVVLTAYDEQKFKEMGSNAPNLSTLTWTDLLVYRQLWALFQKYSEVIDSAASQSGFATMGPPQAFYPGLSATSGTFTIPSYVEPSSPPPSPSNVINNNEAGQATTPSSSSTGKTTDPGSSSDSGDSGGTNVGLIAGVVAGVVGGLLLVALIAFIAVRRRHAKQRTAPASASGEAGDGAAPGSPPGSRPGSASGSVREAFVAPSPTATAAAAAVTASAVAAAAAAASKNSQPVRRPSTGDVEADGLAPVASPRSMVSGSGASGALAAGRSGASQPELIRPLVSTAMMPHSSLPLVPPPAGENSVSSSGPSRFRVSEANSAATTKSPAQLQRADSSLARKSAPGDSEAADGAAVQRAAHRAARSSASVTEGGSGRLGSARGPAPRVGVVMGPEAAAGAAGGADIDARPDPAALAPGPVGTGGSTPVQRTFDTQESYRPRSRASQVGSRPGSGGPDGASELPGSPNETGSGEAAPQRRSMMLPGGVAEFAATQSLLRSEVAALVIAGGSSAEGFNGAADAVMREEAAGGAGAASGSRGGSGGGSPTAARTPAGLRSDSMRRTGL